MTFPSVSRYVLIGAETTGTAGTAVEAGGWATGTAGTATPNDVGLIVTDVTDNLTREVIESLGISAIETQKVTGGITGSGITIEGDYQHGRLFKYIVGSEAGSVVSSDYVHTFRIAPSPPAASIESGNNLATDAVLKHVGQLVENAELSTALNENLKLSVTFKGKTANSVGTASAAVLSTLSVFPHSLCQVKINGSAATEVQNAGITIAKVVERSGGIGSNIYQQGHATEMRFEFSANLGFTDTTFQQLFMGGEAVQATAGTAGFEFEIKADNAVALGSGQRNITLTLENCIMTTFDEVTSVGGLTFIDMAGNGTLKSLTTVDNIITL